MVLKTWKTLQHRKCSSRETQHCCEHFTAPGINCPRDNFSLAQDGWMGRLMVWSLCGLPWLAKSIMSTVISRTQEPVDHDHSDHNGTSGQLMESKVVDRLSCVQGCDPRRTI